MKPSDLSAGDQLTCVNPREDTCLIEGNVYTVLVERKGPFIICDHGRHYLSEHALTFFKPFIQKKGGWIGVDLDGTLAVYDHWRGGLHIGEPIPAMVERVKAWLAQGRDVRIFTARVTERDKNEDGTPHDLIEVRAVIGNWCKQHIGQVLATTNIKDWFMMELWDDRAVQVIPNTGRTLAEEAEAIASAEAGKAATA